MPTSGQRLLAGEPVGQLGAASGTGGRRAMLYLELRRDGQPVDPRAWAAPGARRRRRVRLERCGTPWAGIDASRPGWPQAQGYGWPHDGQGSDGGAGGGGLRGRRRSSVPWSPPGRRMAARAETYRLLNLFGDVFERVRAEYVEPINDRDAIENAINGMLTGLDPHSSYLNQRSFRDMQVQTRGEFGGLGIEVTQESGYIKVDLARSTRRRRPAPGCKAGRPDHPPQRQLRPGPDPAGGGGADARRARHQPSSLTIRREGARPADRALPDPRGHPAAGGRASGWRATTSAMSA